MSGADTPLWSSDRPPVPGPPSRSSKTANLPPGAMEPASPGYVSGPSKIDRSVTYSNGDDHPVEGYRSFSGQRMPSGGGLGDSGVIAQDSGYQASSSSSASRRPLPVQPPISNPPPDHPNRPSSSSMGLPRRSLPAPPGISPKVSLLTETAYSGPAPKPPPRPSATNESSRATSRRALPALPSPSLLSGQRQSDGDVASSTRPLANANAYSPSSASEPPYPSKANRSPARLDRQPTKGLKAPGEAFYDSPTSLRPSTSSPGYSGGHARHSRQSSLSESASFSTSFSSEHTGTIGAPSLFTAETEATSAPTSSTGHEDWLLTMTKFAEMDGIGTDLTIRLPSSEIPRSSTVYHETPNGRGTPTPRDRQVNLPQIAITALDPGQQQSDSTPNVDRHSALPERPYKTATSSASQQSSLNSLRDTVDSPSPDPSTSSHSSSRRPNHDRNPAAISDQRLQFPEPQHNAIHRQISNTSSLHPSAASTNRGASSQLSPSWGEQTQTPSHWVERKLHIHVGHRDGAENDSSAYWQDEYEDEEGDWGDEEEEEEDTAEVNEIYFFQPAFVSEVALQLKYRVQRRRQTKAGIAWVGSFTGRDVITTIQDLLPAYTRNSLSDRRFAHIMAQSLLDQLWFVEVDWDDRPLRDSSQDVFRFMSEMEGMGAGEGLITELPTGLMTLATRCYSPSCTGDNKCYSPRCPFRTSPDTFLSKEESASTPTPATVDESEWTANVDPLILSDLSAEEFNRQTIIRQAIQSEVQYETDLAAMEKLFIDGLRRSDPPVITPRSRLDLFIFEVFSNASELLEACRRLIDHFAIRERESPQRPLILSVGDIFLQAAADFRSIYPQYNEHIPHAEMVLKKELDENPEFRLFCERVVRENDRRRDIKYLVTRPSNQLQRYPAVLEAILNATASDDPDRDFLTEALSSIQNLSAISQLKLFHASKGRGPAGKLQWFDLVPEEQRNLMDKKEQKRQMQIWELIEGEMEYVADLETIENLFVHGLREDDKGIIDRPRLEIFLDDAFHNYRSLLDVHSRLLENLQARQLEQHPQFGMISDLLFDAALNWCDAYMEYVTHYPVAKSRVQEEQNRNEKLADFLKECLKDPASNRQDIYHFINRPIPRLLRYNLLLADILKSLKETGPANHPDIETIPQVIELIGDLGKATQKGVAVNEAKVELWGFQHSLDGSKFGFRSVKDLDLMSSTRELIHKGKVFRQPEGSIGSSWVELIVLLFDNYVVIAKPEKLRKSSRREVRQIKYFVNRRPIPLELLSLGNFSEAPRARNNKTLFSVGTSHDTETTSAEHPSQADSRTVWPFSMSFIGQGQLGGQYTLWTDSYASRAEWQERLQHAKVLRTEVNDATKTFEMTPLSEGTFWMAPNYAAPKVDGESPYTGRVTCSAPFTTVDGRALIAIGCEEGVWIGLRHDTKSLRKVLHVKAVTNVAVLEEFGIFLVLQDKSLLAYHLEALVPSVASPQVRAAPQRLSPGKDIVSFTVGQLSGRTLVLYMKKKGMDSLFRVLEPIVGRNAEDAVRQRRPFGNLLGQRTEWFRLYKDFFIPTEALNVHFLRHKLAVVCVKGFEIMDLTDLKGGSIPIFDSAKIRDRPVLAELQRRCDAARPLGMFRSTETEFLLCYDAFGIYVDRHGEPNRDCQLIEWEGRPDSVAFHPPYLLLISAPFIEIRHIDNAKLLQIYTGSDIHLTWDGTGGMAKPFNDNPGPNGWGDETSSQEPRIHICQRPEDARRVRGVSGIGQHVYELTPTLALNNPLLNPVHTHDSNYFPPAPPMTHRPSSVMTHSIDGMYGANGSGSDHTWS